MNKDTQKNIDDLLIGKLTIKLDITDDKNNKIGELHPLTHLKLQDPEVIQKITEWRNQNMQSFLTQFIATTERTYSWITNVLFKTPGQLLFLVYVENILVGHIGFKNLNHKNVMLDNAIRGERIGHPQLFTRAGIVLTNWIFDETTVEYIYGLIEAKNYAAVYMNKQIGFGGWIRHPMTKKTEGIETSWIIGEQGALSPENKYVFRVILPRK